MFMESAHYSCQIKIKLKFSRHTFKKSPNQILWKYVQWEQSCSMRTDRHEETVVFATSRTHVKYLDEFFVHIPHKRNQQEKNPRSNLSSFCKFCNMTDQIIFIAKSINCNSRLKPISCQWVDFLLTTGSHFL